MNYYSAIDLFMLGGPVMWLLLVTSIIALAIIIDRILAFIKWRQNFDVVINALHPLVITGDYAKAEKWCEINKGPFSKMATIYLQKNDYPNELRKDLLRREGLMIIGNLDKGLRPLAMIAQISTLLGLLGTFHVMIMRLAEGQLSGAGPANFSSSIWEALLTTMYGLLIAIPCSAAYQILEGRVDKLTRKIDILVSYLDEWFEVKNRRDIKSGN